MKTKKNRRKLSVLVAVVVIAVLGIFYMPFLNYTEPTHVGLARNVITGNVWLQDSSGLHVTPPWVFVSRLETTPMKVSVQTTGRGYSAKLVQFDKRYWREFVQTEGFRYYWWGNRISFNLGYHDEFRGFRDIMRGYAYSAKKYPFAVVLEEYRQ